ncbi:MAG: GH3 auxin-responsive promoter family protein [Chitinophagales bacterium]|nr:GH3 auxin-responsive promoter family protein [Chitinophagales bacterium]
MGVKSSMVKLASALIVPGLYKEHRHGADLQQKILFNLLRRASATHFGKEHQFSNIKSYDDFCSAVPVRDYEGIKHYIEKIAQGVADVLWPELPKYFCKSSGTTSGTKYIPLSAESIKEHIRAARNALFCYVYETGRAAFFDKKMIFLQGSPALDKYGCIPSGRLSGIVYHHVPAWAQKNRLPSYDINCIEDWEKKVEAIARETLRHPMSLISGIPPWVVMYFETLIKLSGKNYVKDIFPDFELFVYGGVNYEPYRQRIETLIGKKIPSIETYPASEGFIAFQDSQKEPGLLLNLNAGMFFEFIPADEYGKPNAKRIMLSDVKTGINYALILSSNAGLWAYDIGDTIKFISTNPYRIVVTGRVKHFTSAFGEHVIAEEVEYALQQAIAQHGGVVTEFTVAPVVNPPGELSYHEWLIEFSTPPENVESFARAADMALQQKNIYYRDLREGHMLQCLKIKTLGKNAFNEYMKEIGKLGGQNKVPRLSNDRTIASKLERFVISV